MRFPRPVPDRMVRHRIQQDRKHRARRLSSRTCLPREYRTLTWQGLAMGAEKILQLFRRREPALPERLQNIRKKQCIFLELMVLFTKMYQMFWCVKGE